MAKTKRNIGHEILDGLREIKRGKTGRISRIASTPASKPLKPIPKFRSEDEEREFWATEGRDSTQYLDWSKARLARFPNIKLSTRSISLRLPLSLLERIKLEANKRDVPYQSLIKVWLAERVGKEGGTARSKP